jgi:protein AbiQ
MEFYRIDEEYNQFLQRYEKEKRGVSKVPNNIKIVINLLLEQ